MEATRDVAFEVGGAAVHVPSWLVAGVMGGAWRSGHRVDIGRNLQVTTDGLRTLKKMSTYSGKLFVIYGTRDELMPVGFAESLLDVRYPRGEWKTPVVPLWASIRDGKHTGPMFTEDRKA